MSRQRQLFTQGFSSQEDYKSTVSYKISQFVEYFSKSPEGVVNKSFNPINLLILLWENSDDLQMSVLREETELLRAYKLLKELALIDDAPIRIIISKFYRRI